MFYAPNRFLAFRLTPRDEIASRAFHIPTFTETLPIAQGLYLIERVLDSYVKETNETLKSVRLYWFPLEPRGGPKDLVPSWTWLE